MFRKKPETGGAALAVDGLDAEGVTELYRLEPGSRLVLDSMEMAANAEDLRLELYPVEAGNPPSVPPSKGRR